MSLRFWMMLLYALTTLGASMPAQALPLYAARSGRTCANCHASPTLEDPNGWEDPALTDRKCTLSCISCHVDPTGGGLRNTSGVYYSQSTLGIAHSQDRSYSDHGREVLNKEWLQKLQRWMGNEPVVEDGERLIPSNYEEALDGMGYGQTGRAAQLGHPLGGITKMSFWDGRYGDLNADPLLRFGGDFRLAYWSPGNSIFPMQTDLSMNVHPVHHLNFVAGVAGRSRTNFSYNNSPLFMRRGFVLINELPGMSHVKAGIFMPSFGTYIDDHTSPIRDWFEMDVSVSEDTVAGIEVGTAPNYPFAHLSVFANDTSIINGGLADHGWGSALNLGFRELGWGITGHAQARGRGGTGRGDLIAGGLGATFNPMYYNNSLPFTWLGEITGGVRTLDGRSIPMIASWSQLSWLVKNGIMVDLRSDLGDTDLNLPGPLQHREQLVLSVTPIPGFRLEGAGRVMITPNAPWGADVLVQSRFWF